MTPLMMICTPLFMSSLYTGQVSGNGPSSDWGSLPTLLHCETSIMYNGEEFEVFALVLSPQQGFVSTSAALCSSALVRGWLGGGDIPKCCLLTGNAEGAGHTWKYQPGRALGASAEVQRWLASPLYPSGSPQHAAVFQE